MKKYIILILMNCVAFTACDSDKDRILFDPDNGQTLLSFEKSTVELAILINDSGSAEVVVNSSTRALEDQTFNLSVAAPAGLGADYYNIPSSFTIPANAYQGSFTISGIDPLGEQIPTEEVLVSIEASEEVVVSSSLIIKVFITCPVEAGAFTGDYLVEQVTPTIFGLDTFDPDGGGVVLTLYDESTSEAALGITLGGPNQRAFEAFYVASVGLDNLTSYVMDFVCEEVIFADEQFTFTACGGNSIFLGPGVGGNGMYISGDDSSFTLTFQDDITDSCGEGSPDVTLQRTKQ
jgi:hypothetical protein